MVEVHAYPLELEAICMYGINHATSITLLKRS